MGLGYNGKFNLALNWGREQLMKLRLQEVLYVLLPRSSLLLLVVGFCGFEVEWKNQLALNWGREGELKKLRFLKDFYIFFSFSLMGF